MLYLSLYLLLLSAAVTAKINIISRADHELESAKSVKTNVVGEYVFVLLEKENNLFVVEVYKISNNSLRHQYSSQNMTYMRVNEDTVGELELFVTPTSKATRMELKVVSLGRFISYIFNLDRLRSKGASPFNCGSRAYGDRLVTAYQNEDTDLTQLYTNGVNGGRGFVCSGLNDVTDLTFSCTKDGINFPNILAFASMIDNNLFGLFNNGGQVALCTFKISQTYPWHTGGLTLPAEEVAVLDSDRLGYSGLAVARNGENFKAFVTTKSGQLKKIFITSDGVFPVATIPLGISANVKIYPDIVLIDDTLYITSESEHILVDVEENCSEYKTICACRESRNPLCGWCSFEGRCTERDQCGSDLVWIQTDAATSSFCVDFKQTPSSVARANPEAQMIFMSGRTISSNSGRYQCHFGLISLATTAVVTDGGSTIRCPPPTLEHINGNFSQDVGVTLPISVLDSRTEKYVPMVVPYRLVHCSDIDSCDECVTSHNTCVWCKNEYKCTHRDDTSQECPTSGDQASKSVFGETGSCPSVSLQNYNVPSGHSFTLNISAEKFPTDPSISYSCLIGEPGGLVLPATRKANSIECSSHQYKAKAPLDEFIQGTERVSVAMDDNGKNIIGSVNVTLYNCSINYVCTNCMIYQSLRSQFDCTWCQSNSLCTFESCQDESDNILIENGDCPTLAISETEIYPKYVPVEGNVKLHIPGEGLIIEEDSSMPIIKIDGKNCTGLKNQPANGKDILICDLPSMDGDISASLEIIINSVVWIRNSFITYYNPRLTRTQFGPDKRNYGPIAGGTNFLIHGSSLDKLQFEETWQIELVSTSDSDERATANCTVSGSSLSCVTPHVTEVDERYIELTISENRYTRSLSNSPQNNFAYRKDSTIRSISPIKVIRWGGQEFVVSGTNMLSVGYPKAVYNHTITNCTTISDTVMKCVYPEFPHTGETLVMFKMDGINPNELKQWVQVMHNPVFTDFSGDDNTADFKNKLVLQGYNFTNIESSDYKVTVAGETCVIDSIESSILLCKPPANLTEEQRKDAVVKVYIHDKLRYTIGRLNYDAVPLPEPEDNIALIAGIAGGGGLVVLIMLLVAFLLCRRARYHKQRYKSMVKHVDQLESSVRNECKQAFAELQTDMTDLTSDLSASGIPYWDYKNFTFKILFPCQSDHPSLHKLMTKRKASVMQALDKFEHLINNKHFLISFIHTLENQNEFTMQDRVQLAALLMIALQHKMDYATQVLKELLSELIESSMKKKHPKLLLRRSETVVEKMLTHWLSLCLYKHLQDQAGTPLFMLFKAIKHQIEKGPVDFLTGEARYSLSQDRLLRTQCDSKPVMLDIVTGSGESILCRVNDCDCITQVKEKILDAIYKNQAYSTRPLSSDYNLEWHPGMVGVPITDEDLTSITINGLKKLNTLAHYNIGDRAIMKLVPKHTAQSLHSERSKDTDKLFDTLSSNKDTILRSRTGTNLQDHFTHNHVSLWHLSKHTAETLPKDKQRTIMSEVFLTRLLKTKGTLQDFIDRLFTTIFSATNLPPPVKYLFDFLDQEAVKHGITDPEVVHVWKNNSLNLRFWVNIIKNPEFVFDIYKPDIVDASLSVIAQTFIDSCSMSEQEFGQDAPVNKLLFARDRPRYRKLVQTFYQDIKVQPPVADATLNAHLSELSKIYPKEFYRNSALKEIYQFAHRYHSKIVEDLEDDFPKHRNPNLTSLLQEVNKALDDRAGPMHDYV